MASSTTFPAEKTRTIDPDKLNALLAQAVQDGAHVVAVADVRTRRRRMWISGPDDPPLSVALAAGKVRPA